MARRTSRMIWLDDKTHLYYDDSSGLPVAVPSLSEILRVAGFGIDYSLVDPAVLQRKREIGQAVHRAIELWHRDEFDLDNLAPEARGYFESFKAGLSKLPSLEGAEIERPVGGQWCGYATTPDALGHDYVIEWKTTSKLYPAVFLQLAGQDRAAEGNGWLRRIAVQLRPDGSVPRIVEDPEPEKSDRAFAAIQEIVRYRNVRKIK